jgi:uncharacterized membrane protein
VPDGSARDVESAASRRAPGWREAILVGGVVVDVVLVIAALTLILPTRDVILHTPLTIVVLVVGTVLVLWGVARGSRER